MATKTKILLTGFEPFGGLATNPSGEVVKRFEEYHMDGVALSLALLPVAFIEAMAYVRSRVDQYDVIIMMGVARSRQEVSVERVAINLMSAVASDNVGYSPKDEMISQTGETAYFATFPTRLAMETICSAGIPCKLSYSAGTYVCNAVFYAALDEIKKRNLSTKAVFIHLPAESAMAIERMEEAVRILLEQIC